FATECGKGLMTVPRPSDKIKSCKQRPKLAHRCRRGRSRHRCTFLPQTGAGSKRKRGVSLMMTVTRYGEPRSGLPAPALAAALAGWSLASSGQAAPADAPVSYNRDIRPILA